MQVANTLIKLNLFSNEKTPGKDPGEEHLQQPGADTPGNFMRQKRNFRGHNIRHSRSCLQGNRDTVFHFYFQKHRYTNVSLTNRSARQQSYNHQPGLMSRKSTN